jgi:hypothetical protein
VVTVRSNKGQFAVRNTSPITLNVKWYIYVPKTYKGLKLKINRCCTFYNIARPGWLVTTLLPPAHAMLHIVNITLHLHYVCIQHHTSILYWVPSVDPESVDFRLSHVRTVYDTMLGYIRLGYGKLGSVTYG